MSRRYLIIASIAAHAIFAAALFISGIWKLERLDYRHRASLSLGAMMPGGEAGGGEGEEDEKKEKKKEKKKQEKKKEVIKDVRQVDKVELDKPVETALDTGGGGGEGEGEGPNVGPSTGGGGNNCDPLLDPNQCQGPTEIPHTRTCGDRIVEAPEQCDDGNRVDGDKCSATCTIEQVIIPPSLLTGLRISGETQIVPPDVVKTEMLRDGKERTVGSFKLCMDTSGRISSISPQGKGTGYGPYDAKIVTTMRTWRYRPYLLNNKTAVPACSVVTFVYTIK
jgi:cysteine-rich repeat protein